jgi:hypothetical protein
MKDQIYIIKEGQRYPVNYNVHRYYEGNKIKTEYEFSRGRIKVSAKSLDEAVEKIKKEL